MKGTGPHINLALTHIICLAFQGGLGSSHQADTLWPSGSGQRTQAGQEALPVGPGGMGQVSHKHQAAGGHAGP